MDKAQLPPSGDKHDYLSVGPYFWPNPRTRSGLPYLFRDGQVNPEFRRIPDYNSFQRLVDAVDSLSAAYYFTGQTSYSAKAAQMIRTWFLDPATRMNPNMADAGARRGVDRGAPEGIVELARLAEVIDDVKILQLSPSWSLRDQVGLKAWCTRYFRWLTTSANGRAEAASRQNHGTLYDVQAASLAEFLGDHAAARKAILQGKGRIAFQIRPDGYQPLEMARTRPWNYATVNLSGLIDLAQIGERENIDLWNYTAPSGGGIRRAIDFLGPYASGLRKWRFRDVDKVFRPDLLTIPLRQAATAYRAPKYSRDADRTHLQDDYTALLY